MGAGRRPDLPPGMDELRGLETGLRELGDEIVVRVLDEVLRVAPVLETELVAERDVPVARPYGDAEQDPLGTSGLDERPQELHAALDVLEHVREDDDVEALVGPPRQHVRLEVLDLRMRGTLSRESEVAPAHVDGNDPRSRPRGEVERELALPATDVEHALPGPDAVDEEVVVGGEAVLGVDAAVVADRRAVDLALEVVVEREELPERYIRLPSLAEDVDPGLEDAARDPRRHASERRPPRGADQPRTRRSKTSR